MNGERQKDREYNIFVVFCFSMRMLLSSCVRVVLTLCLFQAMTSVVFPCIIVLLRRLPMSHLLARSFEQLTLAFPLLPSSRILGPLLSLDARKGRWPTSYKIPPHWLNETSIDDNGPCLMGCCHAWLYKSYKGRLQYKEIIKQGE